MSTQSWLLYPEKIEKIKLAKLTWLKNIFKIEWPKCLCQVQLLYHVLFYLQGHESRHTFFQICPICTVVLPRHQWGTVLKEKLLSWNLWQVQLIYYGKFILCLQWQWFLDCTHRDNISPNPHKSSLVNRWKTVPVHRG